MKEVAVSLVLATAIGTTAGMTVGVMSDGRFAAAVGLGAGVMVGLVTFFAILVLSAPNTSSPDFRR
ncbi:MULTISPECIES: hypothetical protein [Halobacterium]|uniref:hypothetical protein n=1 Tax=Halobacterium TaxID=2239 RepID=UPI00073F8795|nr:MULTISPECIES: hypothetical protein [Halobacterium]MCG1004867.1 hypothetical protein [Halobacterium noricense]